MIDVRDRPAPDRDQKDRADAFVGRACLLAALVVAYMLWTGVIP